MVICSGRVLGRGGQCRRVSCGVFRCPIHPPVAYRTCVPEEYYEIFFLFGGRGGVVVRALVSDLGGPGSTPGRVAPGPTAGRRVFSGISHFPRPCSPALLHTRLTLPPSALKTSMLRALHSCEIRLLLETRMPEQPIITLLGARSAASPPDCTTLHFLAIRKATVRCRGVFGSLTPLRNYAEATSEGGLRPHVCLRLELVLCNFPVVAASQREFAGCFETELHDNRFLKSLCEVRHSGRSRFSVVVGGVYGVYVAMRAVITAEKCRTGESWECEQIDVQCGCRRCEW
ncbi:hypothetical protein PR048_023773 [Dryococelus australis]|uniref:Uncharacterized protein n=1 Tax=Dryococelus australis TaxID=614101 RepID=A0ABQ9GV08_9NEOP|nr:hypothetical protein PR048_023773 [Dryococelus australis]